MLPPGTRRRLRQAAPRLRAGRGDCTERASSRPLSPNLIAPLAFTPDFAQTGFRKSSLFYYPRLADACCTNTVLDTFRFTFVLPLVTKQLLSIKCLKTWICLFELPSKAKLVVMGSSKSSNLLQKIMVHFHCSSNFISRIFLLI